ncbi:MAG: formate dehydrogenase accessory sulfurtransferase FdhD [Candidatus Eiseniibacteriota bacterium]|nr:MAG: formate dehydrogenase accessory sulfurtransferase FdhD [Candidatus Eisenbacteria bacterium]
MESDEPLLKHFDILRDKDGETLTVKDAVAVEMRLSVSLDGEEVAVLSCSPGGEKYLALGFLLSEGLLGRPEEVRSVRKQKGGVSIRTKRGRPKEKRALTRILTSGCGGGLTFRKEEDIDPAKDLLIDYTTIFSKPRILALMREFLASSEMFRLTGGTHVAALSDGSKVLFTFEDIGRHNAVDKILGRCFVEKIRTSDKMLLCSGRLSSEIVQKALQGGILVLVSRAAPTSLAIERARRFGITLAGFVRGKRMNVYSHPARISS